MAKKLESTLGNMILSLTLISMVMSAALTFVYLQTKGPIENAARQKEMNAIKQVLPEFDSDPVADLRLRDDVTIYPVKNKDVPVGYAIKTYTEKGFSGHIELMAGFMEDGSIYNVTVLQHKETPGLGTKMTDSKFIDQFKGKDPGSFVLKVKKDGGQVDAITAATISSRAFCDALQRAYDALKSNNDSVYTQPEM
ncbi:MAG: RnfABCDGE type electron transport complex subunit G [Bacteroidales bacterium]|nr:RnfABCDGE type electron transport complex subunit G [Bacteroidales bacterium]